MPRANRLFVPRQVWHLTHRCHDRSFLLQDAQDRDRWCNWIREARSRYGMCVLNYVATSNHIHLLVDDRGNGEIARSMQLVAGRVAQEFNERHARSGQFWQDRYHATAVESGKHLANCVVYMDMNMVRAGAVEHPGEWRHSGFHEIRHARSRNPIIDRRRLAELLGLMGESELREAHTLWHDSPLACRALRRNPAWTNTLAVGSSAFIGDFHQKLGPRGLRCRTRKTADATTLDWANRRAKIKPVPERSRD